MSDVPEMTSDPYTGRDRETTRYFSDLVACYAQHRPDYPDAAVAWAMDGLTASPLTVADVGCGTGILSRRLARHGAQVIGIDPNDEMRAEAQRSSPAGATIAYRTGTAEATDLNRASVDLVTCAQAFHWFDATRALAEFHRILRPEGRVVLLWNTADRTDAFTDGYRAILDRAQELAEASGRVVERHRSTDPTMTGLFANRADRTFENPQRYSLKQLFGRAASSSYFPTRDPHRGQYMRELRGLFDRHQRDGIVVLRHLTLVVRADRAAFVG